MYKSWDDYCKRVGGDREFKTKDDFDEWSGRERADFNVPLHWLKIPKGGWESIICSWRKKKY
jgi:hypothetical protein